MLTSEARSALERVGEVRWVHDAALSDGSWAQALDGATACITGWGTPAIDATLLGALPDLRLVAHTAGSVRGLVPIDAIEQGLLVCSAGPIMADAVAEFVILQMLLLLRGLDRLDRSLRDGHDWDHLKTSYRGRHLGAQTVGVIGTGAIGRAVVTRLRPFGVRILAHDPHLDHDWAAAHDVTATSLVGLLDASDVVTMHAPILPETHHLVGRAELARVRTGGLVINTARSWVLDEAALIDELSTGRLSAALDVFDDEPLPADSPLLRLPNVILSPHRAGETEDTLRWQGQAMVDEVIRFLAGEPLRYRIPVTSLAVMA